jgi:hypothetical protein
VRLDSPANSDFNNNRIVSYSTGSYVVTFYKNPAGLVSDLDAYGGAVYDIMMSIPSGVTAYVGQYSAATHTLGAGIIYYKYMDASGRMVTDQVVRDPIDVQPVAGMQSIPNGAPMIATRLPF